MTNLRHKTSLLSIVMLMTLLIVGTPVQAEQQSTQTLTTAQIEQLVAPIALYPDDLISQILMASTYPLEVVEAARWVKENPKVAGQALQDAMEKQSWDPSVKALTAVPQTLTMMNDQLKWTQGLGDAFLAQQNDVFDAVQGLRARADAAGNLQTTPQQKVTRTSRPAGAPASAPAAAYIIEPTDPAEYYVPIYDPGVVYGAWPYPTYWPFYWYPPGYVAVGVFGFATGVFVGAAIWGGVNWWNRSVNVNVNRYNQFNRTNISNTNWTHNAAHRGGVPYSNSNVASQFGGKSRDQARDNARQNLTQKGQGGKGQGGIGQGGKANAGMGQSGKAGNGMSGMGDGGTAGMAGAKTTTAGMAGAKTATAGAKTATAGMAGGGGGHAGFAGMGGGGHAGFAGMGGGGMGGGGMGGGHR
jgi:Protein of unknown function (DUF3300)